MLMTLLFGLCFVSSRPDTRYRRPKEAWHVGAVSLLTAEKTQAASGGPALVDRDPTLWVKMSSMSQSRNVRPSVGSMICAANGTYRHDWQVGI